MYPSIYLLICLSIYLSIDLSMYLYIHVACWDVLGFAQKTIVIFVIMPGTSRQAIRIGKVRDVKARGVDAHESKVGA